MELAIERACGPDKRTTPMPPRPGGVETAAIVSLSFNHRRTGEAAALPRCRGEVAAWASGAAGRSAASRRSKPRHGFRRLRRAPMAGPCCGIGSGGKSGIEAMLAG